MREKTLSMQNAILGLLASGPVHGYELRTAYEDQLVPRAKLNFGQVYTTLERLQRNGLVQNEVVNQSARPDKKVYRLTDDGRRRLYDWLKKPSKFDLDLRNETFVKLMLTRRLAGADAFETLAVERRECLERLHEITQARAKAAEQKAPLRTVLLLDLAVFRLEAFAKWLDRCEELFREEDTR
ncbi:MAG: PadR family transcriptional regulator [Planctomycetota bacterium]|nr:PadR family transcriptional regulator [Planctomycetota bacterium]MCZ6699522.1 PadR family transcriptional regulator [Planctomycetota bacterium]